MLIEIGTIFTGHASAPGHISAIGIVKAWSTSISWHMVMSNSSATSAFDQMPGQGRIARDRARHRDAPAFVRVAVFARGADREGRQLVEEEVEAVVVVEHHGDVRLLAREPAVHAVEAVEERLPVGIVLLALGDRLADRGNVGRADAADDPVPWLISLPLRASALKRLDAHAGLLRADVLHVEAEDAGELGEVVDVAAGLDHLEHVAAA